MPDAPQQPQPTAGSDELKPGYAMRAFVERQLTQKGETEQVPLPVPDHDLLHRIGTGAYGEVWLARNALGTLRAVKVVYRARFEENRPYEREFHGILKYEPVSRTHEGLVQVLHVGRNDEAGCFYYVMELADSVPSNQYSAVGNQSSETIKPSDSVRSTNTSSPITDYCPRTLRTELKRRVRLPSVEAAQLAHRLASALAHLHAHGLVHRDIKPANVIFVGGGPKLADIGLVTDVGSSQSFVGTEGFIPPEGPGTPQADLYGLGKLLYESATGCDRMDFPHLPPDALRPPDGEALLELNEVMTRACTPDIRRRYSSATELQADLNLFLAGRSLRRIRTIERHLARLKKLAAAACVFLLMMVGALWIVKNEERHARERAEAEARLRQRAEAAEHETQQQLYLALLEQARATVRSGEMGQRVRALTAIRRAAAISNSTELRREALAALALPDMRFERELPFDSAFKVRQLDPAFDRIALCRGRGAVEIRSVSEDRLLATLPASTNLMCYNVDWSRDGRFLLVKRDYTSDGYRYDLEAWDLKKGPSQVLLIKDARSNARAFHPSKAQLLTGGAGGLVVAWDLETGREIARATFETTVERLAYSPDGDRVAATYRRSDGWGASIHTTVDGAIVSSNRFANRITSFEWHLGGRWLALSDYGGAIHLMDARTGETRAIGRHKAEAVTTTFGADGQYLITGGWGRELICWDVARRQRAFSIDVDGFVAQFRADGLACACLTDSGVQLNAFERPKVRREMAEELAPRLRHAAFSSDGRWLAASSDGCMGVWDLAQNGPGAIAKEAGDARPFWAPDGHELLGSITRKNDCYRWRVQPATNVSSPPVLQRLAVHKPAGFNSLCVMSNQVAWTGAKGSRMGELDEVTLDDETWASTVRGVNRLSPDGRWLAIYGTYSPFVEVYRLPDLKRVARLTNRASVAGLSFSPSGDDLAIVSRGQVEFWNTKTWERSRVATNFVGLPYVGALFQHEGSAMWLARNLGTAGLYDAQTFKPLLPLPGGMFPLALSADGRHLAVSVDAQRLQVWDLAEVRAQLRELGLDWANASSP